MAVAEYKMKDNGRKSDKTVIANDGRVSRKFKIPIWAYIAAGTLLVIILLVSFLNFSAKPELKLTCDAVTGDAVVEIHGLSKSKMRNYRVAVIFGTSVENLIPIDSKGVAIYPEYKMLDGECYTFNLVTAKKQESVKQVTWRTANTYCKPVPSDETPDPIVSYSTEWNRSKEPYSHTVTIHVANLAQLPSTIYILGDRQQRDSVFRGIAPGEYEAVVRAGGKSSTLQLILGNIPEPRKSITKQEVQEVFNQVSEGKLSAGAALQRISVGAVKLAATVDGMGSLTEVLHEMEMGYVMGDPVCYTVVGFSVNPNTGLIQSGTLKVKAK